MRRERVECFVESGKNALPLFVAMLFLNPLPLVDSYDGCIAELLWERPCRIEHPALQLEENVHLRVGGLLEDVSSSRKPTVITLRDYSHSSGHEESA